MSGEKAFEHFVAFADRSGNMRGPITEQEYEDWKQDFIWEALHGMRYGQSFCNHFDIQDNHLFYNSNGIEWADNYIRKHYLERS